MAIYVSDMGDTSSEVRKFAFEMRKYYKDFNDDLFALRWAPFDDSALMAFSDKNIVIVIRSMLHNVVVFSKIFPFDSIIDANFLPFASNCNSHFHFIK